MTGDLGHSTVYDISVDKSSLRERRGLDWDVTDDWRLLGASPVQWNCMRQTLVADNSPM